MSNTFRARPEYGDETVEIETHGCAPEVPGGVLEVFWRCMEVLGGALEVFCRCSGGAWRSLENGGAWRWNAAAGR